MAGAVSEGGKKEAERARRGQGRSQPPLTFSSYLE